MQIVFRADASTAIGTGHVMRCLTLADALVEAGARCHFVCRKQRGDSTDIIERRSHAVHALSADLDWYADAAECLRLVRELGVAWLVVDHYDLGREWEEALASDVRILSIDDLGRPHCCNLLLDQNHETPAHRRYRDVVPDDAELLLGPQFALLRPEFSALRAQALARREGVLSRFLVTMGGSDPMNETVKALRGLSSSEKAGMDVDVEDALEPATLAAMAASAARLCDGLGASCAARRLLES